MGNYIESLEEFKYSIAKAKNESEESTDSQVKELMDNSREWKDKYLKYKEEYEKSKKDTDVSDDKIKKLLLFYKKFKLESELAKLNADILKNNFSEDE